WADAVAGAAAAADIGIDRDAVASRNDCGSRTDVETARAAGLLRTRMRAQLDVEIDVTRLFELADQVGEREQSRLHRGGILGIGPQIAVAPLAAGEQRRAAAEIENQVAAGLGAIARRFEAERRSRRWNVRSIIVDNDFERAEMALGRGNRATMDRHLDDARWHDFRRLRQQQRDVEPVGELQRRRQ